MYPLRQTVNKLSQLRKIKNASAAMIFDVTESGKEGLWKPDLADTTSSDNTGTIVVTVDNKRIKRVLSEGNFFSATWFGNSNIWFTSVSDATTKIPSAVRFKGLTVLIDISGTPTEYWWLAGTANGDLVSKSGIFSLTNTLDFGSTGAQSSTDLTVALTGAAVGDIVMLGVPAAAVNANSCFTAWVSATDTVTVRFNNYSSAAIDPASGTFKVAILKQ